MASGLNIYPPDEVNQGSSLGVREWAISRSEMATLSKYARKQVQHES